MPRLSPLRRPGGPGPGRVTTADFRQAAGRPGGPPALGEDLAAAAGPFTIPAGDPARRARCLVCGHRPGTRPVVVVWITDLRSAPGAHGMLDSVCYLACLACMPDRPLDLAARAWDPWAHYTAPPAGAGT